ncbi:hypothetical protein H0B56_00490 [Haloechinothrix sp. YIM 98757]|uniref:Glycoprotein n=1 Tax=Haloechinothrix aidingensis TaxID=2752311 RepID=A0A838A4Z6_9PSEU|nr:DUF6049 family protein [Haloechinothrix aidingensis]MBA0124018.1 hypothetical protein [Haloechinothrix aidingensis]
MNKPAGNEVYSVRSTGRHRAAALLLAAGFLLAQALFGPAASTAQPLHVEQERLALDVEHVAPRVVTADSETLTITATLTNIGDRMINDLRVRVQLGVQQREVEDVRTAIKGGARTDAQASPFEEVAARLEPGESTPVTVSVPIGPEGTAEPGALDLGEEGVYPLLVNVNGQPEYGGPARLAAFSMVLPVLDPPGGETTERAGRARPVSMLWPIAAPTSVVDQSLDNELVLADDGLAESVSSGGRLHDLVSAAPGAGGDPDLSRSVCFAIDPELVAVADAMTEGYRVGDDPGDTVAGRGAEDAEQWLEDLRDLVEDRCVVPMPYGNSDPTVLAGPLPELAQAALDNSDILEEHLGTPVRAEAFWPDGAVTGDTLRALDEAGTTTVFAGRSDVNASGEFDGPTTLSASEGVDPELRAIPTDDLTALGFTEQEPTHQGPFTIRTAQGRPETAAQNALAALVFRTLPGERGGAEPLVLAPPRTWQPSAAELGRLRDALDLLVERGMVSPEPMSDVLEADASGHARPAAATSGLATYLPVGLVQEINNLASVINDLDAAMSVDTPTQVAPSELLRPLRSGLLRATSARAQEDPAQAERAVAKVSTELDRLRDMVRVENPGRTISMASETSPLPVVVRNELPVEVTVRIGLHNTIGVRPEPVSDLTMPANTSYTQQIPATALRAGRFSVDVTLSTPGGTDLGEPARLELASTQYGAITVIVTATAAGALLLLAGHRIYRRVRSGDTNSD